MPIGERKDASILSLRKALGMSDISRLGDIVPAGAFRMSSDQNVNPYVLGAWIRLCQSDFTIESITRFAASQNVMPYIVIGRLQKEKYLRYDQYSRYKLRYKWAE